MTLALGAPAPDFSLETDTGERRSLADLRGQTVILYFYPKDDTPGCTIEACDFRDAFPQFSAANAVVLGVSPDDVKSHQRFKAKFGLPFTLLADPDHAVAERYEVWKQKNTFGVKYLGVERTTFVIDPNGKIAKIFPKVSVKGHAAAVMQGLGAGG